MYSFSFRAVAGSWVVFGLILCYSASLSAQDANALFPTPLKIASVERAAELVPLSFVIPPPKMTSAHRFWDNKNRALFATVAAFGVADFYVTRANLAGGGEELNPVTRVFGRSTPGLVVNFSLEAGIVIGTSYLFHKTGHRKLERITSIVNIGGSAAAVAYGMSHR
jgi:hypothetical protein